MRVHDSLPFERGKVLDALFDGYAGPVFSIRLWDGWQWNSARSAPPAFTMIVERPNTLAALAASPDEVTLGEAFIRRDLDVQGDIFSVFSVAQHLLERPRAWRAQLMEKWASAMNGASRWFEHGARHSQQRDRASIAYHYDQPVEFFKPWLGETLAYSCAYFGSPDDCLDEAQTRKLDLVCRKLRLQQGERFLDIGCGWGSLPLHAAGKHGAKAQGITLSRRQADFGQSRIEARALGERCAVELRDYRECESWLGMFDKMASVGMVEHVGLKNLPGYFRVARRLLRPGGVFLNHGIARSPAIAARNHSFIDRYVFPDGKLVTLTQVIEAAEGAGFEVRDVENLREHYELTLRRWVEGLRAHRSALTRTVSETTYRIWLLYMAGSAAAFHRGDIAVYQVLLSRPDGGASHLPLLREDWYARS